MLCGKEHIIRKKTERVYEEKDNIIPVQDNAALLLERLKAGNSNVKAYSGNHGFSGDNIEDLVHSALQTLKK